MILRPAMRVSFSLLWVAALAATFSSAAAPQEKPSVIAPTDGLFAQPVKKGLAYFGSRWFALLEKDGAWHLARTDIRLKHAADRSRPYEYPENVDVYTSTYPDALFLLQDPSLSSGNVIADSKPQTSTMIIPHGESGKSLTLQMNGRTYSIRIDRREPRDPRNTEARNRLVLLESEGNQTLLKNRDSDCGGDCLEIVRWAGDLDHDGRLDLIIEFTTYGTSSTCLFLSGSSRSGRLVRQVGCHNVSA